jgi:GNAT superfamily N-acetyltransferase
VELRAWGRSMWPLLWPGVRLRLRPVAPDALRRGDIVGVRRGDGLVVHRIEHIDGDVLWLRGDHLPQGDGPQPVSEVLGRLEGLTLGPRVWHRVPGPLARPANRALGRGVGRLRPLLASPTHRLARQLAAALRGPRRVLQPVRIEVRRWPEDAALLQRVDQHRGVPPTPRPGPVAVAFCYGRPVGCAHVDGAVLDLWVHPAVRGLGVGSGLLEEVRRGRSRLDVDALPAHAPWWRRRGFEADPRPEARAGRVPLTWRPVSSRAGSR